MDYIPRERCKEGYAYKIRSRNLSIGVFHKKPLGDSKFESGFVGIREKFGSLYLFTEYHKDDGAPYGTVRPESEIEKCPIENLNEDLGTICEICRVSLEWEGGKEKYTGTWVHASGDCRVSKAISVPNEALFNYLSKLQGPYLCGWCRGGMHTHHRKPEDNFGLVCHCPCL